MNPQALLDHCDDGRLWPVAPSQDASYGMDQAYRDALAVFDALDWVAPGEIASSATQLNAVFAAAKVNLTQGEKILESGCGANVLDGPLMALQHFLKELRACPGAPDLLPGDVITTVSLRPGYGTSPSDFS